MPTTQVRIPKLCKHKATGQAVVRLNGRDHYLGQFGTASATSAYERMIAEWLAHGRRLPNASPGPTMNELILAYWRRCQQHYRKSDGSASSELDLVRLAMRPLKELYGRTSADKFGPLALKAVRQRMIDARLSRGVINAHIGRIKRLFKWAVENELVPLSAYHGLQAVAGLQRGRCAARDTAPVKPVPDARICPIHSFVAPQVWAMIELQLLTGMRPGEACVMRSCDLDTSGRVWIYRPESHKTEHHGVERLIFIGPKAQEVLKPWLKLNTKAYLFSPAEAEAARNAERKRKRGTPMTPSQAKRKPKSNRRRPWRELYDVDSYRRAIQRACDDAFPLPEHLGPHPDESRRTWLTRLSPEQKAEIRAWRRDHRWHPHQLRHNAATWIHKEFGVELARIILGHTTAFTTEIYAEADRRQALEVMAKIG